jgi:BirA family biotin operon repressor/biotin-[acetyl-CoA-carboxylase] ligase
MRLGPVARAEGFRHLHLDTVGSTNADVLARGEDRLWVTAGEQVSGRGRRGRSWVSPPGNLYASLLLRNPADARRAADICFVAALAVSDAIFAVAPRAASVLSLKWPNDVLIGGAKTAGILVEGSHDGGQFSVVTGCGVNIVSHPPQTPYPATHLVAHDATVTAADVFASLAAGFAPRRAQWRGGAGFGMIREAWLSRAAGLGRRIVVRLPSGDLDGVFEALDDDGALILRSDDGTRRSVAAGEIFFPGLGASSGAS